MSYLSLLGIVERMATFSLQINGLHQEPIRSIQALASQHRCQPHFQVPSTKEVGAPAVFGAKRAVGTSFTPKNEPISSVEMDMFWFERELFFYFLGFSCLNAELVPMFGGDVFDPNLLTSGFMGCLSSFDTAWKPDERSLTLPDRLGGSSPEAQRDKGPGRANCSHHQCQVDRVLNETDEIYKAQHVATWHNLRSG